MVHTVPRSRTTHGESDVHCIWHALTIRRSLAVVAANAHTFVAADTHALAAADTHALTAADTHALATAATVNAQDRRSGSASWQDDSGTEYVSTVDNAADKKTDAERDNALVARIVDVLHDEWVRASVDDHPSGTGMGIEAMWASLGPVDECAGALEGYEEAVESFIGPLRAQLLREVDATVRMAAAQVHLAFAIHRAFNM